jgi:hypothetical protein
MKKIILFFLISFFSLEAFKLLGKRWSGLHPVIQLEVSLDFQGFKTHQNYKSFLNEILLSVREWNHKTGANVFWKVKSVAIPDLISNFDLSEIQKIAIEKGNTVCEIAKGDAGKIPVILSSEKDIDGDCSSNSCVYIWSCETEIVHADVTFNNSDFNWSDLETDQDKFNLRTETLKILGQISGLTSCSTGDKESDCPRLGDPDELSVMHKFPKFGKKEFISQDDISGIKTLYGEFNLPFPSSGPYALNDQERGIVQDLINLEYKLGYSNPEGRKAIAKQLEHLVKYSEYRSKKDLKTQYDELFNKIKMQTSTLPREGLKIQRDLLLMGIVTATKTREDVSRGYSTMDIEFINYTIDKHLELWRMTIDRVGGRNQ